MEQVKYLSESNQYAMQIKEIDHKIMSLQYQLHEYENQLTNIQQQTEKLRYELTSIIHSMIYLSILKSRLQSVIIKTNTLHSLLYLLNQEPEMIHYDDDQIYFDVLDQWYQKHDIKVFETLIMKSEQEFFNT